MSIAWVVFRKELRETLRDRRTLMVMLVFPILLYPVLLIATEQFALLGIRRIESEAAQVAVTGPASDDVLEFLASNEDLELLDVADPVVAVRSDSVGAVVVFGPLPEGPAQGEGPGRHVGGGPVRSPRPGPFLRIPGEEDVVPVFVIDAHV